MNEGRLFLFSGSSHPGLAQEVADFLDVELGKVAIDRFPDGETRVEIGENVRGGNVFVMQSVALQPNQYLMELLILIDALRRASARSIVATLPYFGYCRQDRKDKPRVPITAKLVANLLVNAGATRVLTMDLHAGQMEGFFDIPVDNLRSRSLFVAEVERLGLRDLVVVAPDLGSAKLARNYAHQLGVDMATATKKRESAHDVVVGAVIGDVSGRDVLLADDMCSTAGTLTSAAKACREKGAGRIVAAVTHGLFVGDAVERIEGCPIEAVLHTNTIPWTERLAGATKLRSVSVASLFGKAMRCIVLAESSTPDLDVSRSYDVADDFIE